MRRMTFRTVGLKAAAVVFSISLAPLAFIPPARAAAHVGKNLSRILAGARREGVINFAGPATLTPKGADALIAALNKKYGLHLTLHYLPESSYPAVVGRLVTEASADQPPSYDAVYLTQAVIGPLVTRNLLQRVHWTASFPYVPEKAILLNGTTLQTDTQFDVPAYNTKLVSPQDVPKSWEDFLNPRWKGRILVPVYTGFAMYWAQMWGEEKTLDYLRKLKGQDPTFGRYPEIATRLASGEYPLAVIQLSPFVERGQEAGAPVAFDPIRPTFVEMDLMGVPKKARHPNAATLFVAFSLSREGRAVWWKYAKRSSIFTKGSWAEKFSRGKHVLFPDMKFFMTKEGTLRGKFARALGIR